MLIFQQNFSNYAPSSIFHLPGLSRLLIVVTTLLCLSSRSLGQTQQTYYTYPAVGDTAVENPHAGLNQGAANHCNNLGENLCPFSDEPILHIPVNIHFVMNSAGQGNFSEYGDGDGGSYNGYQRAEDIVNLANEQLAVNNVVWNASPPTPIICDIRIKLLLSGVYFHRTDVALLSNNPVQYDHNNFWTYMTANTVNVGSEMNCFLFTGKQGNSPSGQANGATIETLLFTWLDYVNNEKPTLNTSNPNYYFRNAAAKTLLHEVFHNSGLLLHPFQIDNCDDTPTLPQCWGYNGSGPAPCNSWSNISNNLMDYNHYIDEWSLSPCQICRLHELVPFAETQDDTQGECAPISNFYDLPTELCGTQPQVWLQGSASFNENKHFIEIYQTPAVGSDVVTSGYQSNWFSGPVGRVDLRSYMNYNFGCNKVYRVKLALSNDCNDWVERVKYVTIKCNCEILDEFGDDDVESLSVTPNPASSAITVNYQLSSAQNLSLFVYDVFGGQLVGTLKQQELTDTTPSAMNWNVGALPDGWYFIRAVTDNQVKTAQFSVQH